MSPRALGALLCAAGMTVLGASFAVSRAVLAYPVFAGQAVRYAIAAVILMPLAAVRAPEIRFLRPGELAGLAALAAAGLVGFNACLLGALRHADATAVGTVIGVGPLILATVGPMLQAARPPLELVGAAALVVAGVALVGGGGRSDGLGLLLAIGALVGQVLFSLLALPLLGRLSPLGVSAVTCLLAVPMSVVGSIVAGEYPRWRPPTAGEAAALGYLGVVLTVLAFVAWYGGLQRLGPARAGMFAGVMPVAALVTTSAVDGAVPPAASALGVTVVAIGLTAGLRGGRVRLAGRRPTPGVAVSVGVVRGRAPVSGPHRLAAGPGAHGAGVGAHGLGAGAGRSAPVPGRRARRPATATGLAADPTVPIPPAPIPAAPVPAAPRRRGRYAALGYPTAGFPTVGFPGPVMSAPDVPVPGFADRVGPPEPSQRPPAAPFPGPPGGTFPGAPGAPGPPGSAGWPGRAG